MSHPQSSEYAGNMDMTVKLNAPPNGETAHTILERAKKIEFMAKEVFTRLDALRRHIEGSIPPDTAKGTHSGLAGFLPGLAHTQDNTVSSLSDACRELYILETLFDLEKP